MSDGISVLVHRDCLGGERIVEVMLPRGMQLEDLDRLQLEGRREVLDHLPRPFVRYDVPGHFLITGIVSDPRVRFTVRLALRDRAVEVALEASRKMMGVAA